MKLEFLTVPIIVYEGTVQLKGKKKMNPLHPFILELAVKETDLDVLIDTFEIDRRLIQEAIVDLMYKELVYVDLENSKIFVAPEVEDYIDRGRLMEYLEDEYPETVTIKWVQETVSGEIMMFDDVRDYFITPSLLIDRRPDPRKQLQLNRRDYINIQKVSPQMLIKTAKITLRSFIPEGDLFERVDRVYNLNPVDSRNVFIPMKLSSIGDKKYYIPYSASIPSSVIESWTKSLTNIDAYTINDLTPADEDFLAQYHWQTLISKWLEINQEIGIALSNQLSAANRKTKLQRISQTLKYEVLNNLIPSMMDLGAEVGKVFVELIKGEDILNKLKTALDKAKHLVVIGSSFVNDIGIEKLCEVIEKYSSTGIKFILIWGLLGENIEDIKQKYPLFQTKNVSFIKSLEKFHSKFLVIDQDFAWITSCNLFSYWFNRTSPQEIICELHHGPIIAKIIRYILLKVGIKKKENGWITNVLEGSIERNEIVENKWSILTELQDIIVELIKKCHNLIEQPTSKSLLSDTKNTFQKEKNILKSIRKFETAYLIENLEHRKLLRATLYHGKSAIRIGTDRINKQAIGSVIISALNQCLTRGVPIQVRWGRENLQTISRDDLSIIQKVIEDIHQETGSKIEMSDKPSHSHAKFLTMDDTLSLITSFNLFAFAGNRLADDEITDELGVVISSPNATKEIIKTFPEPSAIPKPNKKKLRKTLQGKKKTNKKFANYE